MAFQRGEDTDAGYMGALITYDHYQDLRLIRMAIGGKVPGE